MSARVWPLPFHAVNLRDVGMSQRSEGLRGVYRPKAVMGETTVTPF